MNVVANFGISARKARSGDVMKTFPNVPFNNAAIDAFRLLDKHDGAKKSIVLPVMRGDI